MAINGEEACSPGRETIEDDSASDGIDLNARASSSLAFFPCESTESITFLGFLNRRAINSAPVDPRSWRDCFARGGMLLVAVNIH